MIGDKVVDTNEPPVDIRYRKAGSTTLEQCGWCKFHGGGSYRYDYMISGYCNLAHYANYARKEVRWDTPCIFKDASKADINSIIDGHRREIKSAEKSIADHGQYIAELSAMLDSASDRPPLPRDRHWDHFDIGDPIMLYYEGAWHSGNVESGYRHHDGCVSYRIDGVGPQNGGFWGCGTSRPEVMLKAEAEWFAANPEQFQAWLKLSREDLTNVADMPAPTVE